MIDPDKLRKVKRPRPAPVEFAGQWVAWNRERDTIVAHGGNAAEVRAAAIAAGHPHAVFQKVRKANRAFIGGA
jgi:hypothetical protein